MRSIYVFVEILRTKGPPFQILLIYTIYISIIDVATLPSLLFRDGRVARPILMSPSLAGWPHQDRWTFEGIFEGATNFEFFFMKAIC